MYELFLCQTGTHLNNNLLKYKESILPSDVTKRIAIEMASPLGWHKYVGIEGKVIGIDSFGASAPGDLVVEKYGFTKENILKTSPFIINLDNDLVELFGY